jgi:phage gp16-like protein
MSLQELPSKSYLGFEKWQETWASGFFDDPYLKADAKGALAESSERVLSLPQNVRIAAKGEAFVSYLIRALHRWGRRPMIGGLGISTSKF